MIDDQNLPGFIFGDIQEGTFKVSTLLHLFIYCITLSRDLSVPVCPSLQSCNLDHSVRQSLCLALDLYFVYSLLNPKSDFRRPS